MVKATPNTGELVLSAIEKLTKKSSWSTRAINKFIKLEFKIRDPLLNRKVGRALKRGVKLGFLQMDGGRYRLKDILPRYMQPVETRVTRSHPSRMRKSGNVQNPNKGLTIRSESAEKKQKLMKGVTIGTESTEESLSYEMKSNYCTPN